jgi:hypothetical protein
VWKEFPKQKLSHSSSGGHPHLMLNYLGLSRRRKYRQYFYTANIILRKYVLAKALRGLKKWTADVRRFRVKR